MTGEPPAVDPDLWERQRRECPQEAIDALVAQTTRQCRALFEANRRIAELTAELSQARATKTPPTLFDTTFQPRGGTP